MVRGQLGLVVVLMVVGLGQSGELLSRLVDFAEDLVDPVLRVVVSLLPVRVGRGCTETVRLVPVGLSGPTYRSSSRSWKISGVLLSSV